MFTAKYKPVNPYAWWMRHNWFLFLASKQE